MKRKSQCPKQKAKECIDCHRKYKTLTEEKLCFHCHFKKYGKVGKEWQDRGKGSNQPMLFKNSQGKKQRPATNKGRIGIHAAKDNLK